MPVDGLGLHRLWYVGGRYAYASCHWQGFTDHVLAIIDMQDPTRPEIVGRFWLPGMHTGRRRDAELDRASAMRCTTRSSPATSPMRRGATAGLTILDVGRPDRAEAARRTATGARRSAAAPTRRCRCPTATSRSFADEGNLDNCANGIQRCWVFDVREPANPVSDRDLPDPGRGGLLRQGRQVRPAQSAREPARLVAELGADLRDLPECRGARVRHRRRVPAARGRAFRAAGAGEDGRSAAEPAARHPVERRLRRARRADVPDRRQ